MYNTNNNYAINEFKCVMVGDSMIGKTCLLMRYVENEFNEDYVPTIIADHSVILQEIGRTYMLQLYDTSGQEKYERYRHRSYQDTDVILICFSINSVSSYENVKKKWIPEIKKYCPKIPFVLIGTKSDLRAKKKAKKDDTAAEIPHANGIEASSTGASVEAQAIMDSNKNTEKNNKEIDVPKEENSNKNSEEEEEVDGAEVKNDKNKEEDKKQIDIAEVDDKIEESTDLNNHKKLDGSSYKKEESLEKNNSKDAMSVKSESEQDTANKFFLEESNTRKQLDNKFDEIHIAEESSEEDQELQNEIDGAKYTKTDVFSGAKNKTQTGNENIEVDTEETLDKNDKVEEEITEEDRNVDQLDSDKESIDEKSKETIAIIERVEFENNQLTEMPKDIDSERTSIDKNTNKEEIVENKTVQREEEKEEGNNNQHEEEEEEEKEEEEANNNQHEKEKKELSDKKRNNEDTGATANQFEKENRTSINYEEGQNNVKSETEKKGQTNIETEKDREIQTNVESEKDKTNAESENDKEGQTDVELENDEKGQVNAELEKDKQEPINADSQKNKTESVKKEDEEEHTEKDEEENINLTVIRHTEEADEGNTKGAEEKHVKSGKEENTDLGTVSEKIQNKVKDTIVVQTDSSENINEEKCISREEGQRLARELLAAKYIECSALKRENVIEVFQKAFDVAFKHFKEQVDQNERRSACCNSNCVVT